MILWEAHFADGGSVEKVGLIFYAIKDRLNGLLSLSLTYQHTLCTVDFVTGTLRIGPDPVAQVPITKLRNIRPICFQRRQASISIQGKQSAGAAVLVGIGVQGTDSNGRNVQAWIAVHPDGKTELHTKGCGSMRCRQASIQRTK